MNEFLQVIIALINLPFTVLMGSIVIYWLAVIAGLMDLEVFDIQLDTDIDVDLDHTGSFLQTILGFLNIGEVPVMIVLSILIFSGWCFSVLANHYFNPRMSLIIASAFLIPNLIISVVITNIVTRPLRKMFATLSDDEKHYKILRKSGVITTSEANESFGQMAIQTKGAPVVINVRTQHGLVLKKGDTAKVYSEDKEKGIYFVDQSQ